MENSNINKIKKYFYSGVGYAAHSSEIIKTAVDEFVKQGKLSEKDGQKIVGEAIGKLEDRYNEAAGKVSEYASNEISMLRKKIEELEKKVSKSSPIAARAVNAVKKAIPSKSTGKNPVKKAAPAAAKKAAKKPVVKKAAAKKATASKSPAKKASAQKAPVKKATAKKSTAKKAA